MSNTAQHRIGVFRSEEEILLPSGAIVGLSRPVWVGGGDVVHMSPADIEALSDSLAVLRSLPPKAP